MKQTRSASFEVVLSRLSLRESVFLALLSRSERRLWVLALAGSFLNPTIVHPIL